MAQKVQIPMGVKDQKAYHALKKISTELQRLDTVAAKVAGDNFEGALTTDIVDQGVHSSGVYRFDVTGSNMQTMINGGAFTIRPDNTSGDNYKLTMVITNNASAGIILSLGFTHKTGSFTTVNGDAFMLTYIKLGEVDFLRIEALQ